MKHIPLTQGKFAIVDDADYEWLNQHKWYALKIRQTFYAVRHTTKPSGEQTIIYMHREILGLNFDDKRQGDHRNHGGIDNQRDNLRICTNSQNQQNMRPNPQKNCSSVYKGVCWHKNRRKWQADIEINGHHIYLGHFKSEIDAAKAYDKAASKYFGEFAYLNFSLNGALFDGT